MCSYTVGRIEWDGFVSCSPRPDCEDLSKQGKRVILYLGRDGAEFRVVPQNDDGLIFAGWVVAIERTKDSGVGPLVVWNLHETQSVNLELS